MRNSKAILLFLFSLRYIEKKQIIKYIIVNTLGVLLHATAIIVLPLYFILNKKISRKLVLFIFIAGNIIYLFQIHCFRPILEYLGQLLFGGKIKMLILGYLASDMSAPYGITIGCLERTLSFCLIFYISKRLTCSDPYNKVKNIFENSYYYYTFFFLFFQKLE
jgi:hypothetical protein